MWCVRTQLGPREERVRHATKSWWCQFQLATFFWIDSRFSGMPTPATGEMFVTALYRAVDMVQD